MTINSTTRKAGPFIGNGTVSAFPFGFKVFQASDLFVVRLNVSAAVEQTLVLNSDYSVTLNPDQNSNPGGVVTLSSALASGYTLTLTSDVPDTQPTDLTNQGGFYPEVINDALDRATIQIQQLQEETDRTITAPISTPAGTDLTFPLPDANKFIGWNSTATGLQNLDGSTLASIVAFATAYADTFNGDGVASTFALSYPPATVRNLDVSINGVTQVPVIDYDINGQALNFTTPPPLGSVVLAKYWQALPNSSGAAQDFTLNPNGYTTAVDVQEGFDHLGSSAGTSKIGFLQTGTGAQARSAQDKLREYVSVKDFGAVGDGVTDDTAAIQAALSSGALFVTIPESSTDYRIGDTIDIPAGVTLSGYGASVQALATKTGNLNALGRHFNLNSNSRLLGIKIKPAAGTYSYNPAAYHQVVAMNGTTPLVRDLYVDTTGALATDFLNSIQVMTGAVGAIIESCVSVNGSIQYGTGNATSSLVKNVEIYNAIGNALTASGDTNGTYYGHIIDGFYIVDPARMGIEDYSRQFNTPPQILSGSVIQNGKIVCTGAVTPLYFAVSAVSLMPRISNVHIVNWPKDYAIELMGGCGASVSGCTVEWTDGNPNNVRAVQIQSNTGTFNYGVTVENNLFIRAYEGILARYGKLIAANNTFVDPKRFGISDEVTGTGRGSQIIGNRFVAKSPNATTRFMISIQNQSAVSGNFIEYQSSATGGSNQEWAIVVGGSNSVITGNYVQDNGVVSGASAPYFTLTNGSTPSNVRIIGNTCTGSTRVNYQLFVDLIAEYNVIPGSVTGGSNVKLGFFNKTPIRASGWSIPTGTATRTTFDTATVTTEQLAQRVKALIDDLHATAGYGLLQS